MVVRLRGELNALSSHLRALMGASSSPEGGLACEGLWADIRRLLGDGGCVLYGAGRKLDADWAAIGWVASDRHEVWLQPARTRAALRTSLSTQAIGRALAALGLIHETVEGGLVRYTARAYLGGQRVRGWRLTAQAAAQLRG